MKPDVFVPKAKFDEMDKKLSCSSIVEKGTCQTFLYQNEEWVATGAMGTGRADRWEYIEAQRVQELTAYTGHLEPLNYGYHFDEVDKGNRARSYEGMRVKQGKRELVFVGPEVRFGLLIPTTAEPEPELNIGRHGQLKLFFA